MNQRRAVMWTIESPDGEYFCCFDLTRWCRQNAWRFKQMRKNSKTPLFYLAQNGIRKTWYGYQRSWKGWRIVNSWKPYKEDKLPDEKEFDKLIAKIRLEITSVLE